MMQLIYTNDGLIGLDFCKKCDVIWCHTIEEAVPLVHANYHHLYGAPTKEQVERDIRAAIDEMARTGDTIAEFGVLGGFMFTKAEPEYEF